MAWSHRIIQIENKPGQVLIDDRLRASAPIRDLTRLSWFGVYCRNDPGNHFWDPAETEVLDSLEDELMRLCEQFVRSSTVYVMRIATRGIREYYFYSGEAADFGAAFSSLKIARPEYRIEFDQKSDPEWERYRTFLPQPELPEKRLSGSFFGRLFQKK